MARVLVLSLVFAPDGVSTAQLLGDLVTDLQGAGHSVSVITTRPHYNRDPVAEAAQPLLSRWGGLLYRSDFHGVPVFHTAMPRKRGGLLSRLAGFALFHAISFVVALTGVERPHVIIVPSPLLTAGVLGWLIARIRGAAFVYNVQELYPDIAIKMGQLRNPMLIRMLRAIERFVYTHADAVTVIGNGMRQAVLANGGRADRVQVIPNFVDLDLLRPGPRSNAFSQEFDLDGRFVVSYAGNMGMAQGLESLLGAAAMLNDEPAINFVFVGDGVLRESLIGESQSRGLTNTRFIPHQPYARVPQIYAASDLCVVALIGGIGAEGVPSKLMRIMASGRPVLAIADDESDLAGEVIASGGGVVVPPGSALAIADAVMSMHRSPERCALAGAAGRAYAEAHYARSVATGRYDVLVRQVASRGGRA